jgi:hypothetical protein
VVECLPRKLRALSSNVVLAENKNKNKNKNYRDNKKDPCLPEVFEEGRLDRFLGHWNYSV